MGTRPSIDEDAEDEGVETEGVVMEEATRRADDCTRSAQRCIRPNPAGSSASTNIGSQGRETPPGDAGRMSSADEASAVAALLFGSETSIAAAEPLESTREKRCSGVPGGARATISASRRSAERETSPSRLREKCAITLGARETKWRGETSEGAYCSMRR